MIAVKAQRLTTLGKTCTMGPLEAFWHLLNFAYPAVATAAIAAALAKLLWRRELATRRWLALTRDAAIAGLAALVTGFAITGHDGRIASYSAMVGLIAVTLWWRGLLAR